MVIVEFCLITVLLAVASTEEKSHRSTLFAVSFSLRALLDESTHGCDTSPQGHHNHWSFVGVGQRHCRGMHKRTHGDTSCRKIKTFLEPTSGEPNAITATRR